MSFTEDVINRTKTMEALLGEFGGEGRGLHEKATSLEARLSEKMLKRLRYAATIRNKLLHESAYSFDGNREKFLHELDMLIRELRSSLFTKEWESSAPPKTTNPSATNTDSSQTTQAAGAIKITAKPWVNNEAPRAPSHPSNCSLKDDFPTFIGKALRWAIIILLVGLVAWAAWQILQMLFWGLCFIGSLYAIMLIFGWLGGGAGKGGQK